MESKEFAEEDDGQEGDIMDTVHASCLGLSVLCESKQLNLVIH